MTWERPTQVSQVYDMLVERGEAGITPAFALDEIGCFRLAARISDLKAILPADKEIVNVGFTTKRGARVARYVLRSRVSESKVPFVNPLRDGKVSEPAPEPKPGHMEFGKHRLCPVCKAIARKQGCWKCGGKGYVTP